MKQKRDNTRQSNFELMRIISMIMIILWHSLAWTDRGNVLINCSRDSLKVIFEFIMFIIVVHVNSYVLVSGYFQSKNKFKMSKLLKTVNMVWFYRIVLMIFMIVINIWHPTNIEIFRNSFPINLDFYWFFNVYALLYCISPFLNGYIEKSSKKDLKKLIIVLFLLFSILPYITGMKAFDNNGFTLYNFVLLYFIGAYLRKYPVRDWYIFKNVSKNLFQIICISVFIGCALFNFLLTRFGASILSYSNIFNEIGSNLNRFPPIYSNPFVIIQTIAYFCFFGTLNFKSRIINKLSSLTFGVYLLHDHYQLKHYIYIWTKINNGPIESYKFIPFLFIMVLLIYIVCSIIEWLRQILFKFIYNRNISKKWRIRYRKYLDGLGPKINWE